MSAKVDILRALRDSDHFSVSQYKTYTMCSEKYRYRYVDRAESSHRSVALVVGSAAHHGFAAYYEHLRDHGEVPPLELLTDVVADSWKRGIIGEPVVKTEDPGADLDKVIGLIGAFYEGVEVPTSVVGVEHAFGMAIKDPDSGEMSEKMLIGAIDALVTDDAGELVIIEAKTAARMWPEFQLRYDHQPTVYRRAIMEGGLSLNPRLRFDFAMKTRTPRFQSVEVHRTDASEDEMNRTFWTVLQAIKAGIHCRNRGWMCSDCEFLHCCQ
jgi:hypothetical protein